MMNNILLFEEWNQQLNETKYNFSYNHHRYTIHQAKTNPSKFGIKDKHGEWEVYVRNDIFDPKRFDMEDEEFLSWIQRAIKHFNILGEVTHKEVFESEWKDLFKYELKHKKPLNKRYVILKLQCGKRNAKWNIAERRSKKVDEKLETDPSLKPPKKWFERMHKKIKKQNDYDDAAVDAIIGDIWYHKLDKKKREEIRAREGKAYGKQQ